MQMRLWRICCATAIALVFIAAKAQSPTPRRTWPRGARSRRLASRVASCGVRFMEFHSVNYGVG